jgi:multiple sugar transport system permease protein
MGGAEYIGWENYEKAIGGRKFPSIVTRTFYWMFLSVGLKIVLGLIGASLLASNIRARGVFRALVMPPWIVPIAIGCFGWLWLYNGHFGLISNFIEMVGITDGPFSFLAYKQSAFYSAVVTDVWIGTPMVTLFFLAAIQGVPREQGYHWGSNPYISNNRRVKSTLFICLETERSISNTDHFYKV